MFKLKGGLWIKIVMVAVLAFLVCPLSMIKAPASDGQYVNSIGVVLPPDAAPPEEQVLRTMCIERRHLDVALDLYDASTSCGAAYLWERLTMLDENYNVVPGVAERWELTEDGLGWVFHLREAYWSDGSPVTAHDFEYALKRQLSPEAASSWAWFYYDIKNAKAYNEGKVGPEALGVKALDDHTLLIETETFCPYLPMLMAFPSSAPVPKKMVEAHGDLWTTKPEWCLTNSTFKLEEWTKGKRIVITLNPYYKGIHKAYLEKIILYFGAPETHFPAYQAGEIDAVYCTSDATLITPADLEVIRKDPELSKEVYIFPYLGTWYIFFDTFHPPFDNLKVRQAISHSIDREAICEVALGGLGTPAYGMLPPGMPGYQGEALKDIQRYDPELARELMAEAGYPDGKGFPVMELWLRGPSTTTKAAAEMIAAMLKQNLGIEVKIRPVEKKLYSDALIRGEVDFSLISWLYDYVDPSDFLDVVWHSEKGRHEWKNDEFDRLIEAARMERDPERRLELYRQAERILVEDVGGVFLWHPMNAQMWQDYVRGLKTDRYGYTYCPYYNLGMQGLYIAKH